MPRTPAIGASEAALTGRAAAGDASAIGELYSLYEKRAFNLAYRITGSQDDAADATQDAFLSVLRQLPKLQGRELVFSSYLFTTVRNACYDLIQKRKRAEPSDVIPEGAAPVSSGGAFDPGDPEDDPDRKVLLAAQQEEIRQANDTLPERQREALALRELEDLSYDEIAEIMDMNRNSVAQLISRARVSMRDALRGTALASVAVSSPDCERALPLIAAAQDGERGAGGDTAWLDQHLAGCDTCRVARDAMEEAGTSYRAWVPIAASPLLFKETMAMAAEQTGADLDEMLRAGEEHRSGGRRSHGRRRLRDALLAGAASIVLLLGVFAAGAHDGDVATTAQPVSAAGEQPANNAKPEKKKAKKGKQAAKNDGAPAGAAGAEDVPDDDDEDADTPGAVADGDTAGEQRSGRRVSRKRSGGNFEGRNGNGPGQGLQGFTGPPAATPDPPAPDPPPVTTTPPETTPEEPPTTTPQCRDPETGRPVPCRR